MLDTLPSHTRPEAAKDDIHLLANLGSLDLELERLWAACIGFNRTTPDPLFECARKEIARVRGVVLRRIDDFKERDR